ncbi:MAG TPA: DUF4350 domain-containing protein [Verrucomicrobiae bacterium]|nr:DUF4350 domain-containing protein [Verrucomicrobiae bacterium]
MNRNFPLILLLVCVAGFVFGILELFKLRFETGDVYPPYSSLRTDPLGASAFYESLARVPDMIVSRDFKYTDQLPPNRDVAYLHLAGSPFGWDEISEQSFKEIQYFLNRGGRLVIALDPQTSGLLDPYSYSTSTNNSTSTNTVPTNKTKEKKVKQAKSLKKKRMISEEDQFYKTVSLEERWGFGIGFQKLPQNGYSYEPVDVVNRNEPSLPESISWHSGAILTNLDSSWRVIYTRGKNAVLAERHFGSGSVVFSTDSYFLSNEALQKDRHAELLSWIIGPCREVVFDEAHLGIVSQSGVATLLRNYHLHGFMAGLLLLAGLFIWKNSVSFVPPHEELRAERAVTGKDSATGFVNLLRRHIKSGDLVTLSFAEWKKTVSGNYSAARLERVESLVKAENSLPQGQRNPIATYRLICQVLKEPYGSGFRVPGSELRTGSSGASIFETGSSSSNISENAIRNTQNGNPIS